MAHVLDLRASGGELTIIGRHVGLPHSDDNDSPLPLPGSIRYNPTNGAIEVYIPTDPGDPSSAIWTAMITSGSVPSENDTLATVTARGATTDSAIIITNLNASTSTTSGALVVSGGVGISGAVNIGGTLTLAAGTSTQAPLSFSAGTTLSAPTAHAVEWDGSRLYLTQSSGPTRKTVAYTEDIPPVAVSLGFEGEMVNDDTVGFIAPLPLTLPANFDGSICKADTNPSATVTWTVNVNGSPLTNGTIELDSSGVATFGSVSETNINAGDVITVVGPSTADADIRGARIVLIFKRG